MTNPIVRLRDLEVHFPLRGGAMDSLLRRMKGVVRAVDGIDLDLHAVSRVHLT